jgi:hypothetical protein
MVDLTNLDSIMNMRREDVPVLHTLPKGRYRFTVQRARVNGPLGQNNRHLIEFSIKPTEVIDGDFDESALDLTEPVRLQFWMTDKSLANKAPHISVFSFFETLGLDAEDGSFSELLEATVNRDFEGTTKISERSPKNPEPVAEVERIFEAA